MADKKGSGLKSVKVTPPTAAELELIRAESRVSVERARLEATRVDCQSSHQASRGLI